MDNETVSKLIESSFGDDPEVREVAMYALASLTVNDAVIRAIMGNKTEVEGIPPELYVLMKRFDNGLVQNTFWQNNYVAIKSQLALDDVKLNTMSNYIGFFEKTKELQALKQVRAILLSRFDSLTTIAFFYKGQDFAEKFDPKLRLGVQLTPEHEAFFKQKGLGD